MILFLALGAILTTRFVMPVFSRVLRYRSSELRILFFFSLALSRTRSKLHFEKTRMTQQNSEWHAIQQSSIPPAISIAPHANQVAEPKIQRKKYIGEKREIETGKRAHSDISFLPFLPKVAKCSQRRPDKKLDLLIVVVVMSRG